VLSEHEAPEARFATDHTPSSPQRDGTAGERSPLPAGRPGDPIINGADGDVVVDIPHLTVDELTVELAPTAVVEQIKVTAKGLDLGLFLKVDLEQLVSRETGGHERPEDTDERRRLEGGPSGDEHQEDEGDEGHEGQSRVRSAGHRAVEIAKEGGKAASLTAAGVAGGALLESTLQPSRKLPGLLRRRRSGPAGVIDRVREHLP
jgi:hypothetical protein